jgi:hypothetical protein
VLWNKLKISYDDLEEEEKHMFLDIACFFDGYETNTTFLGLRNLKDRSLVKITKDGYLNMHEQLKDMGQKIAMEQRSRIFIWNPKKPNFFLANQKVCYMLTSFNQFDFILELLTHLLVSGLEI